MRCSKYEIDMLNVRNADAFLIHFYDESENEYIILVDGGNYDDGKKIAEFIRRNYDKQSIDLAICTHCDKDHFGGLLYLLEQQKDDGEDNMQIKQIWVDDPANHVPLGQIKWSRIDKPSIDVKARSVFDIDGKENLLDLIESLPIEWKEPFSNPKSDNEIADFLGLIKVVGPTQEFYKSLVPDFRNDLKRKKGGYDSEDKEPHVEIEKDGRMLSKTLEEAEDDPSSHNQSSVIFTFVPDPDTSKKFLFTGDACRVSFENLKSQKLWDSLQNVYWLKVPHHGSKHNLDSDIINHLKPQVAYVSTEKYGHYLSKAVVVAMQKVKTDIYTTNSNGSMCHHHNTKTHDGYSNAKPIEKM